MPELDKTNLSKDHLVPPLEGPSSHILTVRNRLFLKNSEPGTAPNGPSTAWSIEGVTSQGKDRASRSLAYNLGTIASDYHLAVLSDAVFEVVSLREVGDASIQNIVEKIASNPEEFYGSFATMKLRTNSSLFCSIPCASEKQFQDQLVSLGFSQGPWFAYGSTYSTLDGNVVAGANPLDPATLQPAFVFVDYSISNTSTSSASA